MSESLQLIEECKKNSQAAFEKLYNLYAPKMKGIAYRYVGDAAKAEDVVHDSFVKIYEKIATLQNNAAFEGWLRKIVVNESLDALKRDKKLNEIHEESFKTGAFNETNEKSAYGNISAKELMDALNSLPVGYKTVFNLYVIDGFSHKEIASRFNISEGTSKSQLSKAKDQLKKKLEHKLEPK